MDLVTHVFGQLTQGYSLGLSQQFSSRTPYFLTLPVMKSLAPHIRGISSTGVNQQNSIDGHGIRPAVDFTVDFMAFYF